MSEYLKDRLLEELDGLSLAQVYEDKVIHSYSSYLDDARDELAVAIHYILAQRVQDIVDHLRDQDRYKDPLEKYLRSIVAGYASKQPTASANVIFAACKYADWRRICEDVRLFVRNL
jgi:hypothetical protein